MSSASASSYRPGTPPYPPSPIHGASAAASASGAGTETAPAPELTRCETFDEMELDMKLLRGVYSTGFEKPSNIQQIAILPMKEGRDLLAQAQSGTGKTATFVIGGLTRIDTSRNEVQMVVISPTRELSGQTYDVAKSVGQYMGLRVHKATGGPPVSEDISALVQSRGAADHVPHLLVVTPGRFYDLLIRRALSPDTVRVLVMDEADQLLGGRFREQIHCILNTIKWPSTVQVALLSATMIPEIRTVARDLLYNPVEILLEPDSVSLDGIKQWYIEVPREEHKLDTLCDIYDHLSIQQATIFVNTKQKAEWLADQMKHRGFDLDYIHGEMDVKDREKRMEDFRAGRVRVLIATDLLGRGIDVQTISVVINYELPLDRENYIHRIGRSGRYGRKGASINLICPRELRMQGEIEAFYGKKIAELPMDLNIF
jgi:superfamily II DNA/RNA helicase